MKRTIAILMVLLATAAFGEWSASQQDSTAGDVLWVIIPNQEGYSTMICEATAEYFARTDSIDCHDAVPFPTPDGLK